MRKSVAASVACLVTGLLVAVIVGRPAGAQGTLGPQGDITAVNAGSGVVGGAQQGPATIAVGQGSGITVNADDVAVNNGVGLVFSAGQLTYDSSAIQTRVSNTCTSPNSIRSISSTGVATCTTGVAATGTGTTNTLSKYTAANTVGNSAVTDDGTTFSVGASKLTVVEASGNTGIAGTLGVTGLTTVTGGITGLPTTSCATNTVMTALGTTGTGTCAAPPTFTSALAGYVPASGGGTTNFMRADGSWAAPAGGGNVSTGTLTTSSLPKASGSTSIVDSLLSDNATTLSYNAGKFTVASASGNTTVAGTLAATGNITENSVRVATTGSGTTNALPKYSAASAITNSSATDDGTTFAIATNKLTVTEASGNTAIAGTLAVAGALTENANRVFSKAGAGLVRDGTDAFQVDLSMAGGTCSTGNVASALSATGTLTCTAIGTQGGATTATGTTNTIPKYTSGTAIGNSAITDDGTTVSIPARVFSTTYTATGQTINRIGLSSVNSGTFNTTGGALTTIAGNFTSTAARSAGAASLTSIGVYSSISGAQVNTALQTDAGDVKLNQTGGVLNAHGASTFDSTVGVTGLLTLSGGVTGLTTTSCSAGTAMTAFGTTGTGTCSSFVTAPTGTANTMAKFSGAGVIGNSMLTDDATTLSYNAGKLTVDSATGNTAIAGTLGVTAAATFSSSVTAILGTLTVADFRATQAANTNGTGTVSNVAYGTNLTTVLWTCGAPTTITGIANGAAGRRLRIFDVSGSCTFVHNSASSSAGNRFFLAGSSTHGIAANDYIEFEHDGTQWREVAASNNAPLTSSNQSTPTINTFNALYSATAGVTDTSAIAAANTGTYNTTAAVHTSFAVKAQNTATRSAGANNLTNIALYGAATSGQANYALWTDQGDVNLNAISGTTTMNTTAGIGTAAVTTAKLSIAMPTLLNGISITQTATGLTSTTRVINIDTTGTTYDISSASKQHFGVSSVVKATYVASSDPRTLSNYAVYGEASGVANLNYGLYGSALNGGANYALYTDQGDISLNTTGGTLWAHGTSTIIGDDAADSLFLNSKISGNVYYTGTTPTASGCGSSPTIIGNQSYGAITLGTAAGTTCQIIFGVGSYTTNAPICVVTPALGDAQVTARATTSFTIKSSNMTTSQTLYWHCGGI